MDVTKPCPYCGRKMDRTNRPAHCNPRWPTIDHKVPRSRGGSDHISNLVWACRECNEEKGSMTVEEYMEFRRVVEGVHGRLMRRLTWKRHCIVLYGLDEPEAPASNSVPAPLT